MNNIGFFSRFLPALVAYRSRGNTVDIAHAPRILETARTVQIASHGISDVGRSQVLILLLMTLIFIALFVLVVYLIVRRLIRIERAYRELVSNGWIDEPEAHWRKCKETNLFMQTLTEQQWLFNLFISHGHDDTNTHDLLDLPHDWCS
jgi:HAMP domain-containing protein